MIISWKYRTETFEKHDYVIIGLGELWTSRFVYLVPKLKSPESNWSPGILCLFSVTWTTIDKKGRADGIRK